MFRQCATGVPQFHCSSNLEFTQEKRSEQAVTRLIWTDGLETRMKTVLKFLKILGLVTLGLIVLIFAMVVFDMLIAAVLIALASALGMDWIAHLDSFWLIVFVALVMPKGWIWRRLSLNKPYVCHATQDIQAPVAQVWDLFRLRPRNDYYSVTMPTVVAVDGVADEFELQIDPKMTTQDDPLTSIKMKVDETIENFYIRMHCTNPLFGKDLISTEIWMEDLGNGSTRVTYAETLSRLTLVTILAFVFLNPARDGLKRAKALCEGKEDTSWMTKAFNDVGPNGETSNDLNQNMTMIAIATTVVLFLMTYGVMWFVLSLPS